MPERVDTPHNNHGDSLRKRYFYKLLTNLIGLPVYLVTQAIIPRGWAAGLRGFQLSY